MTFSFFARTRTAGVSVCTCANFGTRGPSAAQFRARQRHLRYNLATFGSCQMSVYNWPKSEHRRSKYQSKSSKPSLIFHTFLAALILFFNLFSQSTLFLFNIPPTLLSEYRGPRGQGLEERIWSTECCGARSVDSHCHGLLERVASRIVRIREARYTYTGTIVR